MRFAVLGPITVTDEGGDPLPLHSPTQRHIVALLAAGLTSPNRAVISTDSLIENLWDGAPPRAALTSLRAQISRLRRVLGGVLVTEGSGYRLAGAVADVDAARFDRVVRAARAKEASADDLRRALGLWRGRAFDAFADSPLLRADALRLEAGRVELSVALARAVLALGNLREAEDLATSVVEEDDTHEPAWTVLVDALTAQGRPVEATRAHARAVAALDEAGFSPGPELSAAQTRALRGEPPSASTGSPVGGLAPPRTRLIGREPDLTTISTSSTEHRLVTLTGPGGVGKTLLALHAARALARGHSAGVRVVELARVTDGAAAEAALAAALSLGSDPRVRPAGELDALLLLDNCEHVIDTVARLVPRMLDGGDRLRVLATSREPLAIAGEYVHQVEPLPDDGPGSPARELFLARARAAGPQASAAADRLAADDQLLGGLIEQLDALPLAMEMAAARLSLMSPEELGMALDTGLDVLHSRRRDLDERQRSVRAVLAWSEALLDDEARRALAAFCVFSGPVSPRDAERVTQVDRPVLDDLVAQSMLVVDTSSGAARLRALAIVRTFGRDRLFARGEDEAVRRRHAEWVAEELASIDRTVRGPDEARGLLRYGELHDEYRVAHRWARENAPGLAARLTWHGHLATRILLRSEPMAWAQELRQILSRGEDDAATDPEHVAVVDAVLAACLSAAGDLDGANRRGQAAVRAFGGSPGRHPAIACAYEGLLDTAIFAGDLEGGLRLAAEAAAAAAHHGDLFSADLARVGEAMLLGYAGHLDRAVATLEAPGESASPSSQAWLAYARGEVILDADPPAALAQLDRAVQVARAVGDRYVDAVASLSAITLRARAGDPAEARSAFVALLAHYLETGEVTQLLTTLRNAVTLLVRLGAPAAAARLSGTVALNPATPTYGQEAERLQQAEAHARADLGAVAFERQVALGLQDTLWDAARLAREAMLELGP